MTDGRGRPELSARETDDRNGGQVVAEPMPGLHVLEPQADLPGMPPDIRRYTMEEVSTGTDDFSTFLDEDQQRPAFHARFPSSTDWRGVGMGPHRGIVRLLPLPDDEASLAQSKHEFVDRIVSLSRLTHPDMLNLTGYAYEDGCFVAVFEPAQHTLFQCLHSDAQGSPLQRPLSWRERMRVVLGVVEALSLMHSWALCPSSPASPTRSSGRGDPPAARRKSYRRQGNSLVFDPQGPFVHGAIKSCNVLLTPDHKPKLFDGLVPRRPEEEPLRSVSLHGSFGYLDPNYADTRTLSAASDVYSLGVLLLEVVSGRPALDADSTALIVTAQECFSRREDYVRLLDPALGSNPGAQERVPLHELVALLEIAQDCTQVAEEARPSMLEVKERVRTALLPRSPTDRRSAQGIEMSAR